MSSNVQRLSVIEQELQDVREREQHTQMTLNTILEKLNTLSLQWLNPLSLPVSLSVTPNTRPQLKASLPNKFSGDRNAGLTFLNSCKLYVSLCKDQFIDDQAQIHWVLSFMKEGRAAQFTDRVLHKESYDHFPMYESWLAFEREFVTLFLPLIAMSTLQTVSSRRPSTKENVQ